MAGNHYGNHSGNYSAALPAALTSVQSALIQHGLIMEPVPERGLFVVRLRGVSVWRTDDGGLLTRLLSHQRVARDVHDMLALGDPPFPLEWLLSVLRHLDEDGW